MSSSMIERSRRIGIGKADSGMRAVTFSTDNECLISGGLCQKVGVWRAEDQQTATDLKASDALCLAVSKNSKWIAAGTHYGEVFIWDSKTNGLIFTHKEDYDEIRGVDFSPDSTRLVSASLNCTATIWDFMAHKQVRTLWHEGWVIAAKFSPRGNRIATAAYQKSIRIWDSSNGRLLVDIPVIVTPLYNDGLLWSNDHLFVVSDNKIKQLDASTKSTVSDWSISSSNYFSCIALPGHGKFIAYSTQRAVTLWDTSTGAQLGFIQHSQDICSIAVSPNDQFLAIGGEGGKITIRSLSSMNEPDVQISDTELYSWKRAQFQNVESLLTVAIQESQYPSQRLLTARALVLARLGHWDAALVDAEMAIDIQPSIIGYIAKSAAHVGKGEKNESYRACDVAFEHAHSSHVSFLLLVKAIIVFMAGEYQDAISRVDDLIATLPFNSICYTVQAYMLYILGNMNVENSDYENAIQSFERARAQIRQHGVKVFSLISLISGWDFDDLDIMVRQRLCETLYKAGHKKIAEGSLLEMLNTSDSKVYASGPITKWISDFTQQCLSTPKNGSEADSDATQIQDTNTTVLPTIPTPLLREWAKVTLASRGWKDALVAAADFTTSRVTTYLVICERLEKIDCVTDAVECFHEMMNHLEGELYMCESMIKWVCDFTQRRLSDLHSAVLRTATLQGNPPTLCDIATPLLTEWAKANLACGPWKNALASAGGFKLSRVVVYRAVCERLGTTSRIADAVECFHQMMHELGGETNLGDEPLIWARGFRRLYSEKLEHLGDTAADAQQYDQAISHYTVALSLISTYTILVKRGKVFVATGLWNKALVDADQAIMLDQSSPWSYEIKHAALHGAKDYDNAVNVFDTMLSKMEQSPNLDIRQCRRRYKTPAITRTKIYKIVQQTLRDSPRVLINTATGRLHDRAAQASAFEALPIFNELVSSMTTRIDRARIEHEVRQYFQYVMLSHKWEENEPLYQQVIHITVYDLDQSPTHDKLQMFCKIVRSAGFNWAWSDTCCINKVNHFVLQEALVAMFRWYRGSALTIVFLRGVRSSSQLGALVESIWNTRAWTLQEYVASKVIHFYTEDWTPYLQLELSNHKESPEVISEMEQATRVSAQQLMTLRPGLSGIREKLCLASTRQTTLVEDAAYSLLGIFSVTGIPAIYGEGEASLGRLLSHVLAGSGDLSILAWTGESGSFNSCLPAHITVFSESAMSHLPASIPDAEMNEMITASYSSSFDLNTALKLYDRLNELTPPWFAAIRMKLPCIAFQLPPLPRCRTTRLGRIYRVATSAFGMVEIKTRYDLSRMKSLCLVHPWLNTLLEREVRSSIITEDDVMPLPSPDADDDEISDTEINAADELDEEIDDEESSPPEPEAPSNPALQMDRETRARRLVAHLRRPFGALLLALASAGGYTVDYKRVAADSVITVQFQENVSLADILENVRTLDVL